MSAGLNPILDPTGGIPPAVLAGIETALSGSGAEALGLNAQGAVSAAQNETLNNYLNHLQVSALTNALQACASGDTACVSRVTATYQALSNQQQLDAKNCDTAFTCQSIQNDAMQSASLSISGPS